MKIDYCPLCAKKLYMPARSTRVETPILFPCSNCGKFYLPAIIFEFDNTKRDKYLNYAYYLRLKEGILTSKLFEFVIRGNPLCRQVKGKDTVKIELDALETLYPKDDQQRIELVIENMRNLAGPIINYVLDSEIGSRLLFLLEADYSKTKAFVLGQLISKKQIMVTRMYGEQAYEIVGKH